MDFLNRCGFLGCIDCPREEEVAEIPLSPELTKVSSIDINNFIPGIKEMIKKAFEKELHARRRERTVEELTFQVHASEEEKYKASLFSNAMDDVTFTVDDICFYFTNLEFIKRPTYTITHVDFNPLMRFIQVEWEAREIVVVSHLESANTDALKETPITTIGKFKHDFGVVKGNLLIGFHYSPQCVMEITNYKFKCTPSHVHLISVQFFGYTTFVQQKKYTSKEYKEVAKPIYREMSRILCDVFILQIKSVAKQINFATIFGNSVAYGIKNHVQSLQKIKLHRILDIIMSKFTIEMRKRNCRSVAPFFLIFRRDANKEIANPEYAWILMHGRKRFLGDITDESLLPPQEEYLGEDAGVINFRVGSMENLSTIRIKPNRIQFGYFNKYTGEYHIQLVLEVEKLKQIYETVTIDFNGKQCSGRLEQTILNEIHLWFSIKIVVNDKEESQSGPSPNTWSFGGRECRLGAIKSDDAKFFTSSEFYKNELSFLDDLIPKWGLAHFRGSECFVLERDIEDSLEEIFYRVKFDLEEELNQASPVPEEQPEPTPGPSK